MRHGCGRTVCVILDLEWRAHILEIRWLEGGSRVSVPHVCEIPWDNAGPAGMSAPRCPLCRAPCAVMLNDSGPHQLLDERPGPEFVLHDCPVHYAHLN